MKFAHKITNVPGGNRLVTVTVHNGKGLVKTTFIPTEMSKDLNIPFKTLVYLAEFSHEKYLREAVSKLEQAK